MATSNFSFLTAHDPQLARLGTLAERYFHDDAPAALIRLRQLAEFLACDVPACTIPCRPSLARALMGRMEAFRGGLIA